MSKQRSNALIVFSCEREVERSSADKFNHVLKARRVRRTYWIVNLNMLLLSLVHLKILQTSIGLVEWTCINQGNGEVIHFAGMMNAIAGVARRHMGFENQHNAVTPIACLNSNRTYRGVDLSLNYVFLYGRCGRNFGVCN